MVTIITPTLWTRLPQTGSAFGEYNLTSKMQISFFKKKQV